MKFMTRGKWFIATGMLMLLVFLYGVSTNNSSSFETSVEVAAPAAYVSTSSVPLRVGGLVEATNEVVVYAQVSGVLKAVPVVEGVSVLGGQLLAQQSQPVAEARLGLTAAQGELSQLQQAATVVEAAGVSAKSGVQAYSAADVARIRVMADQNRLTEVSQQFETTLESGLLTSIEAIDFISQNRGLFTSDSLREFDEVVEDIYGRTPNYFARPIKYGTLAESSDLIDGVKALGESGESDLVLTRTYSAVLRNNIDRLLEIYADAETEVYDRTSDIDDDTKTEYETNRNTILSTLASLEEVQAAAQVVIDTALSHSVTDEQNIAVTAIDETVAGTIAQYAKQINVQTAVVDQASQAVVAAELSLGQAKAPFAGVVTEVFVDPGDYVTPGTPLLRLSGTDARELTVTAPAAFADSLAVGQEFVIGEQTIGYVTSFSSVSKGGSVPVTISLSDTTVPIGTSLVGHINIESNGDLVAVPRQYLFFTTTGPFVRLVSGSEERFEIVYDDGELVYGRTAAPLQEPLVQATGIHF